MPKFLDCPKGHNALIATLPEADRLFIERRLSMIELPRGMIIEQSDVPTETVVFPTAGVCSMVVRNADHAVEVALFGRDGMSGSSYLLGSDRPTTVTTVQVPGTGLSISAMSLREVVTAVPSISQHLLKYVFLEGVQKVHTSLATNHVTLEIRLARWILMCHDRIDVDKLRLTHDALSMMLGVRRAGVTVAIHLLEGKALIKANRGEIIVINRDGLEREAGWSYGLPEREYNRVIRVIRQHGLQ